MLFGWRVISVPVLVGLLAVVLAGAGAWVSAGARGDAVRRHAVAAGVPLDEVHPPRSDTLRPGVVVAHGFAGSARLMAQFGDVLVARGYVVVLLDFTGHGANTRPLPPSEDDELQRDLGVAVDHLRGLPDVDPARIALVGHSMGAGAVVRYGADHPDVTATVAISLPDASDVRPGAPRRLLPLVGAAEFTGFRDAATRAAAVSGGPPAVVVPGVEHVSILWAPRTHREVVAWLDDAFGTPPGARPLPSPLHRLLGAGLLAAAFVLGIVPLARLTLGGPAPGSAARGSAVPGSAAPGSAAPGSAAPGSPPSGSSGIEAPGRRRLGALGAVRAIVVTAVAAVVAALVAAIAPTTLLPMAISGFLDVLIGGTGALLVLYRFRAPDDDGRPTVRAALAAVVLTAYAGAAIAVPLQAGVTQAVPVGPRWWLLLLIWAAFALLAYGAGRVTGGSSLGLLLASAVTTIVLTAAAVTGLTSGFVLLVVPLLAVLTVWQAAWTAVLRRYGSPVWVAAPVGALVVAWPVAVTLPLG